MKFAVWALFFISSLGLKAEVVSLTNARLQKSLSRFVGMYRYSTMTGVDLANIVMEDDFLTFWYPCGNIASSSLKIDLREFGGRSVDEDIHGLVIRESGLRLPNLLYFTVTTVKGRTKVIEKQELFLSGHELYWSLKREYFKKSLLTGRWNLDEAAASRNISSKKSVLPKVSSRSMSSEAYIQFLQRRPTTYVQLTAQGGVSADNLREQIEQGHYRLVTGDTASSQVSSNGQILPFRKPCEEDLDP